MTDPAIIIASAAVCIAIMTTTVASIAIRMALSVAADHRRLSDEFWRQSHLQADSNVKMWKMHQSKWEHVLFIYDALKLSPPKPPEGMPPGSSLQ